MLCFPTWKHFENITMLWKHNFSYRLFPKINLLVKNTTTHRIHCSAYLEPENSIVYHCVCCARLYYVTAINSLFSPSKDKRIWYIHRWRKHSTFVVYMACHISVVWYQYFCFLHYFFPKHSSKIHKWITMFQYPFQINVVETDQFNMILDILFSSVL
jgi:hypothetical protein